LKKIRTGKFNTMSHPTLKSERLMTPFIAFCYAKRDEVRAANPMARFGDMSRLLSARWKELSESEKSAYAVPRYDGFVISNEDSGLRRSSRLRNKRLGLNFWGLKQ